jgi:hypothetical protein
LATWSRPFPSWRDRHHGRYRRQPGEQRLQRRAHDQCLVVENLDLSGVLANALGATLAFTAIKAILIVADSANTNNVVVGGAASNGFVGRSPTRPTRSSSARATLS